MIIHFICRGNAFRSRMAEAYFNSLNIKDATAISSGTVAKLHSQVNKDNFKITQTVLEEHGLKKYTKPDWDQLTQERLDSGDITVYLSKSVKDECDSLFKPVHNTFVLNVPDFDEAIPKIETDEDINGYAENTFTLVASSIDEFAHIL